MARLFYGMNQSLDGYVDHDRFAPDSELFDHFITQTRELTGSLYGRRLYELMRYWDDDQEGWSPAEFEFAHAWRSVPKWVASGTLTSVGPNATLVNSNLQDLALRLKSEYSGEIEVGGTVLARSLAELGLIDEYRIYVQPVVLGAGTSMFNGFQPRLTLDSAVRIGNNTVKLTCLPVAD